MNQKDIHDCNQNHSLFNLSQVIHKFSLINPYELDHFIHSQQTFSFSKYLYLFVGHISSKTFTFILVILVRTQKANSVLLLMPFYHQELEILGWFTVV